MKPQHAGRIAYRDTSGKLRLRIQVDEELFHFIDFPDWVNHAQLRYRNYGHTSESTLAVDSKGLVCVRGKQFMNASYPVRVYSVDEAPYKPTGTLGTRQLSERK